MIHQFVFTSFGAESFTWTVTLQPSPSVHIHTQEKQPLQTSQDENSFPHFVLPLICIYKVVDIALPLWLHHHLLPTALETAAAAAVAAAAAAASDVVLPPCHATYPESLLVCLVFEERVLCLQSQLSASHPCPPLTSAKSIVPPFQGFCCS